MHADELRSAVSRVVEVLNKSDILAVVKEYRTANGDDRAVAAARLGHSGAVIMESMDKFSVEEKAVVRCMFLDSLGTTQYWQSLLASAADPKKNAADLVHLFSRAMFSSTHLPNLVNLLGHTTQQSEIGAPNPIAGEERLTIRLTDAGERASDPDRIARSIDGIDMLYSACASIARKPAMDLRLDSISGGVARDVAFMGERDSIAAVSAVIGSIPDALEDIHPDDDLDLDALVASLPIFQDLNTLASLGTFTQTDLKDISETMHQGGMLVLESGVILVNEAAVTTDTIAEDNSIQMRTGASTFQQSQSPVAAPQADLQSGSSGYGPSERDEHYERYLREREAMQSNGAFGNGVSHLGSDTNGADSNAFASTPDAYTNMPGSHNSHNNHNSHNDFGNSSNQGNHSNFGNFSNQGNQSNFANSSNQGNQSNFANSSNQGNHSNFGNSSNQGNHSNCGNSSNQGNHSNSSNQSNLSNFGNQGNQSNFDNPGNRGNHSNFANPGNQGSHNNPGNLDNHSNSGSVQNSAAVDALIKRLGQSRDR